VEELGHASMCVYLLNKTKSKLLNCTQVEELGLIMRSLGRAPTELEVIC
jgi:hypothetical protein